ncbi:hypothetical protein GQ43DRAFT_444994 [Delitschia confertaspora ATCC 74209]|uniref:Symplekin/Pta1 N-terminal domain-containing protein n=1 Tax=Delitschia confertaspora ATCC 74209 TaxID=1513339 RepID=A0A9P4ML15_9PLEO|nr:hypothetical protein GQ43DRAFT_444994 [Delitschia confertaspora ATCC 74209]
MNSSQTLQQLESARNLALGDGRYYPTIIPGVLPIIGVHANAPLEIRRWGADFLAETFASPTWSLDSKETSCLSVLPTLKDYLDTSEDTGVIKSAVQAAACIYPLVYRHTISDPSDSHNWQTMGAIKSNILRRMDTAPPGVRICCVKFVQQVVLVETPAVVDPRRPDNMDISLTLVPRDHPLISYSLMEAESSGLLDRLLDIIHGEHSDALLITATLNCLGTLLQRRPVVTNRVLQSVLAFNPLKLANSPMTPKNKVMMKSIEKTNKMLLTNYMKRHPESPHNGRIHQHLERISHMRADIFDNNRKRPAPAEPTDGLDAAKRQRLGAVPADSPAAAPPLPSGPISFAQLFTLAPPNSGSTSFDVSVMGHDMILKLLVPLLHSIDQRKLDHAVNLIRGRYQELSKRPPPTAVDAANQATGATADDDEEYEPDFDQIEDAEQIHNKLDNVPPETAPAPVPNAPLAPFKLPQAPPLTEIEIQKYGDGTVRRLFGMMAALDEAPSKATITKPGFNRLAASNYDRDSWLTIICRLATRTSFGLEDPSHGIKSEDMSVSKKGDFSIADTIREALLNYIIYDWRKRIDVATNWLCEEWYNDRIQQSAYLSSLSQSSSASPSSPLPEPVPQYQKWTLKVLDKILPFVESTDKMLIRFISEIPELDREILKRVGRVADDPDRVQLSVMICQYLLMFRPPVRGIVVDLVEGLWRDNEGAKPFVQKILVKYRPAVLQTENHVKTEGEADGGEVKPAAA